MVLQWWSPFQNGVTVVVMSSKWCYSGGHHLKMVLWWWSPVQNGATVVVTSSKWCYSGAHQFKMVLRWCSPVQNFDRDLLKEIKNKSYHEKKNET
jgi:hypothetical protein